MRIPSFSPHDSVNKRIFRAAFAVALATVVVKASTIVKDLAVAHSFGRSDNLDAFLFAFMLPAFVLNLIVGAVSTALVPVLVEVKQKDGIQAGQKLLSSVMAITGVVLCLAALLLASSAHLYLPYLAHSFSPQKQLLTRDFLYLLAPWLVFSGLSTFMASVLNAIEKFAVPAMVPILTPLAIMACIALWRSPSSGFALVVGTVAGSFLEAVFLYSLARIHRIAGGLRWHGLDPQVRAVVSQTGPMMAGALLMGATPLVDQSMAAMLGAGSISALSYGSKITTGLLAIGATALGTATLPYFSRMAADSNWQGCRHTLKRYSLLVLSVTIPLTALLMIFSRPLVKLLFQRGAFTSGDTDIVSRVQMFFCLQIPFYVLAMLFVRFISSARRNDFLMYASGINLVVNIVMNLALMRIWGVAGIALSTSIVSVGSLLFLCACSLRLLSRYHRPVTAPLQEKLCRLTLVISTLEGGGAERVMSDLASEWAEQGKVVTILTLDEFDAPAYFLHPAVKLNKVNLPRRWPSGVQWFLKKFWRLPALRRAIRESEPDLIIAFMPRPAVLTLLATRLMRIPVVVSERANPKLYKVGFFWGSMRRALYPFAAGLVVETQATLECFKQMIKIKGYVIPNFLRPHDGFATRKLNSDKDSDGHVLAAMGRLVEQKGFDLLLEAFARIAGQHPDWSLEILGSGPLESPLKLQAAKLGLQERVRFLGQVSDPFPILRRADLFAFSSRFEGYGLALAEAMACGLPVISFDCPSGPGDIIRHNVDGLLVPAEDISAMATALNRLMGNPQERARLAGRAPEVLERFNKKKVLALWSQVFKDTIQGDSLSPPPPVIIEPILNRKK
ncbi:MAG TPA: lipid II flippase MurJ [Candidatus Angelobacter sp.]|nr:lipid II flippase MurJ [Candidatus Angelobacter sp.]